MIDIDKAQLILEAAFDVAYFSKTHEYPAEGSPAFCEFAQALDRLATAINAAYPRFNSNVAARMSGKACDSFAASEWENTMRERCGNLERDHS